MKVNVLHPGGMAANCYVFYQEGGTKCGIVDPGGQGDQIAQWIKDKGLEPEAVLLTHGHFDHILGLPGLLEEWPHLTVYCHPDDFGEGDTVRIFGETFPTPRSLAVLEPYIEEDVVDVAGVEVTVLETPGHTPGSVTLRAENVLFTGDTLFAGSMGRTDLPGGNEMDLRFSLRRLGELEGDYHILPGHEGPSTLERERQTNPCLRSAMGR